ncbi:MAG: S1C family serine protease [Pirellulaceae bacterium]
MKYRGTAGCQLWLAAIFLCDLPPIQQTFAQSDPAPSTPRLADRGSKGAIAPSLAAPQTDLLSAQAQSRDTAFQELASDVDRLDQHLGIYKRLVRLASPSVVHIDAKKTELSEGTEANQAGEVEEAGSGVLLEYRGRMLVITNRHVVVPAQLSSIAIQSADRSETKPLKLWSDAATDIAVMEVPKEFGIAARVGDSDRLEVGEQVVAIGSPFGLAHSVTTGILSAKGRRDLELGTRTIEVQDFFQTDAAINPGNSGGPLFNLKGEVIAINTAIASNSGGSEGIGFSIPINLVMGVVGQLVEQGEFRRGYLGIVMDYQYDVNAAQRLGLPTIRGVLIKGVRPKSPAETAGLRAGDVLLEYNGEAVESDSQLVQMVSLTDLKHAVPMTIWRQGRSMQLQVRLAPLPTTP